MMIKYVTKKGTFYGVVTRLLRKNMDVVEVSPSGYRLVRMPVSLFAKKVTPEEKEMIKGRIYKLGPMPK